MQKLISFFVRRPVTASMVLAIFLFLGLLSLTKLPLDLFPSIGHPQLSVVTTYEHASAEEIEKNITKPLEEELSFLKNLFYLTATSEEGISRIHLLFQWGSDMDFAALEVREKLDLVKNDLPESAEEPKIERFNPNADPILVLNLVEDNEKEDLRQIAQTKIKPKLERILGVAQIRVLGGQESEIEVAVDPDRLTGMGLAINDITQALSQANIYTQGGSVRYGNYDLLIKTSAKFQSLEEIENTIIRIQNKNPIYLKNVATVHWRKKEVKTVATLNGKPSVSIAVFKEASGNTLTISKQIQNMLQTLQKDTHTHIEMTYDQSQHISDSISLVRGNAILGALLTILVLFIFLRNFASTFILVLAIPFSILCSLSLFYVYNVTLNIFSLAGIALALGMAVDASIVILENIFVHLRNQEKPQTAATHATVEVSGAVIASTLTTLAVFIPILFVQGPIGLIFKDLSLAILFGLFFSMLISFLFIPMVSSQILDFTQMSERLESKIERWKNIVVFGLKILDRISSLGARLHRLLKPESMIEKAIEGTKAGESKVTKIQEKVTIGYEKTLKEAIRSWQSRLSIIVIIFFVFIVSVWFLPDTEFFPESTQKFYEIGLSYPRGTSLEYTHQKVLSFEKEIQDMKNIQSTSTQIQSANAKLLVQMKEERKTHATLEAIRALLKMQPDLHFHLTALNPLTGITQGLNSNQLDFKLKGLDAKILRDTGTKLQADLQTLKGVESIELSDEKTEPQMLIRIDRAKASDVGLTSQDISESLKQKLHGIEATQFSQNGKEIPILVRSQKTKIYTQKELENLSILSPYGKHISLGAIASFQEVFAPPKLTREEKERTVTLLTTLSPGTSISDFLTRLPTLDLPPQTRFTTGPNVSLFQMSFVSLKTALIIAIILIYLIMAAQFESLVHPLTILFSVPLSLIGITTALVVTGKMLSISAFIGIIILVGISVNNAIILIDYINILRRRGMDREEAILAAGKRRLRPILMTSLTTTLGMLPLALGIGAGTELYQPLAIVVFGGMISSTFLTLLFIPTIYCFFDDLGDILGLGVLKLQVAASKAAEGTQNTEP